LRLRWAPLRLLAAAIAAAAHRDEPQANIPPQKSTRMSEPCGNPGSWLVGPLGVCGADTAYSPPTASARHWVTEIHCVADRRFPDASSFLHLISRRSPIRPGMAGPRSARPARSGIASVQPLTQILTVCCSGGFGPWLLSYSSGKPGQIVPRWYCLCHRLLRRSRTASTELSLPRTSFLMRPSSHFFSSNLSPPARVLPFQLNSSVC